MKKSYISTVVLFCCLFALYGRNNAYALDITAGMTSWYAWGEQKTSGADKNFKMESDPTLLFGPTLSAKLSENFNLTFVYLYGKFDYEDKKNGEKLKSKRNDIDLALNYRLSDYFKIFGGIKYMSFDTVQMEYTNFEIYTNGGNYSGIGLGFGLNVTFPIAENLFLLATLSGFYGFGEEKIVQSDGSSNGRTGGRDTGYNSNLSVAYYIASASTAISLGGRYQHFNSKGRNDFPTTITNTIWGITLSATYSFNI